MMRLMFTGLSALLMASAAALWWTPEPAMESQSLPDARSGSGQERRPEIATGAGPPPPAPQEVRNVPEAPEGPEVPRTQAADEPAVARVAPPAGPVSIAEETVELPERGEFAVDVGPEASGGLDEALSPELAAMPATGVVDPERSAGWVQRLLALYEVVRE